MVLFTQQTWARLQNMRVLISFLAALLVTFSLRQVRAEAATCDFGAMGPCYTQLSASIGSDPSITESKGRFCSVYSTFYHCMRKACGNSLPASQLARVQQEQEQYGFYCDVSAGHNHSAPFWLLWMAAVISTVLML